MKHSDTTTCFLAKALPLPLILALGLGLLGVVLILVAAQTRPAAAQSSGFTELLLDDQVNDWTKSVAWGDMDGDGDLDLAVGNDRHVNRLYRNDGGGVFTELAGALGNSTDWTNSIAWGDMDGDGDLDLAVGNNGQVNCLYRNDGGGVFTELPGALGNTAYSTQSLAWGDMDGDGDLDLAVGNGRLGPGHYVGELNRLYRNDGGGVFTELPGALGSAEDPTFSVAWGDMDGDGDLDLAVGNVSAINRLYRNDGGGIFTELPGALGTLVENTQSVAWGDMDGDGDLDLAIGNSGQVNRLYRNDGGGVFTEMSGALGGATNALSLAWGDMDSDGDLDLAIVGYPSRLYRNDGGGIFTEIAGALGSVGQASSLAWGDMDGDGDLDLAAGIYSGVNRLFRNDGVSAFSELPGALSGATFTFSLAWGDMDGDGDLDLAVGNGGYTGGINRLYRNLGSGRFEEVLNAGQPALGTLVEDTRSVAWGDMDGDGDLDLAVGNYYNQPNRLYRNDGGGVFTELPSAIGGAGDPTNSLAWGDMDGDGDLDLATGNDINGPRLYRNDGGGVFTELPGVLGSVGGQCSSVAWGDMDGDGDLDLAAGYNAGEVNRLFRNDGGGLFTELPGALGPTTDQTESLAWGDMDDDGDLDLAVGNVNAVNRLYRNDGGGVFTELHGALGIATDNSMSLAWGDVDGDGDLDLAVGNYDQVNRLYRNDGGGVFTELPGALGSIADWTYSIAWGDMDGDGDLDLAVGNYGQNRIYRNPRQHPASVLPDNQFFLSVQQPADLPAANFYAISGTLSSLYIPFTYTLYSPDGSPAAQVLAQYSLNGGGNWTDAVGSALANTAGLWESFDPIAGTQWRLSASSVITTGLCGGVSGSGLNFSGPITVTRQATTRPLDFSNGGTLYFSLRIGAGAAPCENADPGEDILLEYSLDGIAWSPMVTYTQDLYPSFTPIEIEIPADARSPSTRLRWRQVAFNEANGDNWALDEVRLEIPHTFLWDTFASDFFGQSSNVVMRFKAMPVRAVPGAPGTYRYPNSVAGPFQQAFGAASTLPFPARGTQVRVYREQALPGNEALGALVYRLPQGELVGSPIASPEGQVYRTDLNGYLTGHGKLQKNDTLYALLPITTTQRYTLYATNGIPMTDTLKYEGDVVEQAGVQPITVTLGHPLLAFNLDISLEWDARNDGNFLLDLDQAIQNASAVLFDISDGQIVIGDVHIYQNRENWLASDIVMYAQTGIRPRASMGGVVDTLTDDLYRDGRTIHNAYGPGQIRIGPNWDPFGASISELTVDWQRALAHELSHYLLYLPDNYLGVGTDGSPISIDCRGSFMTNTYDDDYSEFLTRPAWLGQCQETIAENTTGRVDWETVTHFYSNLIRPGKNNPGPAVLPLDITRVSLEEPGTTSTALPPRFFDVREAENGLLTAVPHAQAFIFQDQGTADPTDDQVLSLGSTLGDGDRTKVRGASIGDRLCLFGPPDPLSGKSYAGCIEELGQLDSTIPVSSIYGWQPILNARAVTSTTLQVTVTLSVPTDTLQMQFFPAYGDPNSPQAAIAPTATLHQLGSSGVYTTLLDLPAPAFEGWLRVWIPGAEPVHEAMSQLFLSPPWGPNNPGYNGGADTRAWGANNRQLGAPVASGDGQVSIFNFKDIFADTGTVSLQALNSIPSLPVWLTQVGQPYRFSANAHFPRAIAFDYLQRDLPPGYEYTLTVYYSADEGATWERLVTQLDQQYNRATAIMPENTVNSQGIYALVATVKMPALDQGWNLFAYTIPETRPVDLALASIAGKYTSVYLYANQLWSLFDATVIQAHPEFTGLVNDLGQMESGRSYWLYATEPVTPYLGVPAQLSSAMAQNLGLPPATYYGWVTPWLDFHPELGDSVTAWIDGNLCGSGSVADLNGQLAYKIQVAADNGNGCGVARRKVIFRVNNYELIWNDMLWDNTQAHFRPLGPPYFYYLPLVFRSQT